MERQWVYYFKLNFIRARNFHKPPQWSLLCLYSLCTAQAKSLPTAQGFNEVVEISWCYSREENNWVELDFRTGCPTVYPKLFHHCTLENSSHKAYNAEGQPFLFSCCCGMENMTKDLILEHQYCISLVTHTENVSHCYIKKHHGVLSKELSTTSRTAACPCSGSRCFDSGLFNLILLWKWHVQPYFGFWIVILLWSFLGASPSIMSGMSSSTSLCPAEMACSGSRYC